MNMICPHCGLQGKAEEELLGKKVRCPECQKVFRATDGSSEEEIKSPEQAAVPEPASQPEPPPSSVSPAQTAALQEGKCYKCSFSFEEIFSDNDQSLTICSVCGRKRPIPA